MAGNLSALGFGANNTTRQIVNADAVAGFTPLNGDIAAAAAGRSKEVLSGALTANILATVLSLTGPGEVPLLTSYTKDTTARTVRTVVIVDGVTVFDFTSASISVANRGAIVAGELAGTPGGATFYVTQGNPIRFSVSLVVQQASNLTETDKLALAYIAL
jgi:hypothetical protein